ncbi:Gfo/Idh/MocA family protein [Phycisphaerales bacterium AB-hyl4]|uniref:Gfo/Idh/MocA family protein n=1 Tax=Natronomicrosphaera hydrolytica TaxID=3242702 RepID=A0ABV4TZA0_9BACT
MSNAGQTGIGLFGFNGHQLHGKLADHPRARLVGIAGGMPASEPSDPQWQQAKRYENLTEMLADPQVQLVSLCSARRAEQAEHAVQCLEAGKHVYAEKPCALDEADIDRIVATAKRTGRLFHEMAGTAFDRPYLAMSRVVREGRIGEVVQVLAQKSYPYRDTRPQDEAVDGGLTVQAGVHATRMIEQVAGQRIKTITAVETTLGNPVPDGELRMASSLCMRLANGGVASMLANYLNQSGTGVWGNEDLRIFGTKGFVESIGGGTATRIVIGDDVLELPDADAAQDYFELFLDELIDGKPMPMSVDDELHPTRVLLRARASLLDETPVSAGR